MASMEWTLNFDVAYEPQLTGSGMNPITHFMVTWVVFERQVAETRDKALVCLAGVAPDVDGLGIVADFTTRQLGLPETNLYQEYHRVLGHGLLGAVVISGVAAACASRKALVGLLAFLAVHLHFLCDIVGSRGSTVADNWPIYYFAPFSLEHRLSVSWQWPLVGWQNLLVSALFMGLILWRATITGYSPVIIVSRPADAAFVEVLRKWRKRIAA